MSKTIDLGFPPAEPPMTPNSFTDSAPGFPYRSSEARSWLNLPESPAIHLAVTDLAQQLLPLAEGTSASAEDARICALHSASGGVLFSRPFEVVRADFLSGLQLADELEAAHAACRGKRTDWLGQAVARLRAEGIEVASTVGRQRSRYGWLPKPPSSPQGDTGTGSNHAE